MGKILNWKKKPATGTDLFLFISEQEIGTVFKIERNDSSHKISKYQYR